MSTRSLIGIKKDNKYVYVYCHFDGYPEGVGKTLIENYTYTEIIEELILKGDMSSLENTIESTTFYEDDSRPSICDIHNIPNIGQEFIYMWYNKKWHCGIIDRWESKGYDWSKLDKIEIK